MFVFHLLCDECAHLLEPRNVFLVLLVVFEIENVVGKLVVNTSLGEVAHEGILQIRLE